MFRESLADYYKEGDYYRNKGRMYSSLYHFLFREWDVMFRKSRVDYYREGDYRNTGFGSKYNYYDAGKKIIYLMLIKVKKKHLSILE